MQYMKFWHFTLMSRFAVIVPPEKEGFSRQLFASNRFNFAYAVGAVMKAIHFSSRNFPNSSRALKCR
jgi:hypothetical protein